MDDTGSASVGGGYVFVSYARSDQRYVDRLVTFLEEAGIRSWIDRDTDYGSRWPREIRDRVDDCAALIAVMTPAAEESVWVERELDRALASGKPIFPLLRSGRPFFTLGTSQYIDVTNGSMPPASFVQQLVRVGALGDGPVVGSTPDGRLAGRRSASTRGQKLGRTIAGGAGVGVIALLVAVFVALTRDDDPGMGTLDTASPVPTDGSDPATTPADTADGAVTDTSSCFPHDEDRFLPELQVFLDSARAQAGDRYVWGAQTDPDDPDPEAFDSAELVEWAAAQAGVDLPDVSATQYSYLQSAGATVPVEQGIVTPGALLFMFGDGRDLDGYPDRRHVAISLGNCQVVEARGAADGVGVFDAGDRFTHAAVIPAFADVYVSPDN